MASRSKNRRKVRLVFGHSAPVLRAALAALVTFAAVALIALAMGITENRDRIDMLRDQAARLEQENAQLESRIENLGTNESIRQIAAEELGLVDPNTIVIETE